MSGKPTTAESLAAIQADLTTLRYEIAAQRHENATLRGEVEAIYRLLSDVQATLLNAEDAINKASA